MAGATTTSVSEAAQRYAAAVFDMAITSGEVDAVDNGLTALGKLIDGDKGLSAALKSPLHKSEEKAAVLAELSDKLGLPQLAKNFIGVVALNRRAGDIPGMAKSFAEKAAKHRGALAPLRVSGWSTGVWASIALGFPIIGGVVAAGTAVALSRKLRFLPDAEKESARLATLGHLHAGKQIASAVTRVWWPIALLLALVSRRARWALCLAAFVPALSDWWTTRPHLDPVRYTLLRWVDDMSYGFGVWKGVVREGNYDPLIPELSSWPSNMQQKSATEV